MIKKYLTFLTFAVILTVFGMTRETFAQKRLELTVENYIAGQAKREKADEYGEARKIISGDLNGDGNADAVLQYTLEGFGGGNSFAQMLVVFINKGNGVYRATNEVVIGGKMATQTSTLDRIANRKIVLNTESCPPDAPQGMCDNPKKGVTTYVLRAGKLRKG